MAAGAYAREAWCTEAAEAEDELHHSALYVWARIGELHLCEVEI
jgi:hypothetical protein